jgi:hypothetical protein
MQGQKQLRADDDFLGQIYPYKPNTTRKCFTEFLDVSLTWEYK